MSDVNLKLERFETCRTIAMKYGKTVVDDSLIVPDVKPDIKKILCVSSWAYITGVTPSQDKVHIEGVAKATVLYMPDGDVIGSIKALNMSREFGHSIDVKGVTPDSIVSAEAEVDKTSATLINSRKVNVRISVSLGLKICRAETVEIPTGIEEEPKTEPPKKPDFLDLLPFKPRDSRRSDSESSSPNPSNDIQLLKTPVRLADKQFTTDGSIIVRDQYEVPSKLPEVGEILLTHVSVEPEEAVTTDGNTRLKGTLRVSIMYEDNTEQNENSAIRTAEFTMPYTEQFDTPNAVDDMECEPEYTVREVYTEIRDNQDGEAKIIGVEAVIGVSVSAYSISEPMAVTDAYALGCDLKTEMAEISPEQIADIKTAEITHKTTAKRGDTQPEIAGICCAQIMRTSVDDIKISGSTALVKGSLDVKIICITNDEAQPVTAIEHTTAFENSFECENLGDSRIACDAKIFVSHCGYNISGSDAVDLRFIIGVSLKMVKNDRVKTIKSIECCESEDMASDGMQNYIIYFVQSGDTLWNIAKRYRTTVDDIVKHNNIPDRDKIMPGQKIKIYA